MPIPRPIRAAAVTLSVASLAVSSSGCADPCVDDGLGQKHCPEQDSQGGDGTAGDGATTDPSAGTADGGGQSCPVLDKLLTPDTPTVMLLVDQSGSMTTQFDTSTRWEAVGQTLFDATNGVVAQFQSEIRFGLTLYTSHDGELGGACPILTDAPSQVDNYDAMKMVYDSAMPDDETPTGDSITAVTQTLLADTSSESRVIVLATDGEPDTCAEPNPQAGQEEAVAATQMAYDQGILTFVISVGNEVSEQHLQDMANAGVGAGPGDPDAPFYMALDQAALLSAFQTIVNGVRSCRMTLSDPVDPGQESECTVSVNGTRIPLNDPDGWRLDDPTHIELRGNACTSIQEGEVMVEMVCDCSAVG